MVVDENNLKFDVAILRQNGLDRFENIMTRFEYGNNDAEIKFVHWGSSRSSRLGLPLETLSYAVG